MSRTVSARIPKELHEELRDRCNKVGCSINDFLEASIEFILNGHSEFDFGDEESEEQSQVPTISDKSKENHEGKKPMVHFYWDNGKLVQGETTWEEK